MIRERYPLAPARKAADLQRGALPKKKMTPFLEVQMQVALSSDGTNSQALQIEVQLLLCPFASTALLGHGGWLALWLARALGAALVGGVLGIAFGGVLVAAAPRAFVTAAFIATAMSSSVGSAAALFLVNCALSAKAAGTSVAEVFGRLAQLMSP